MKQHFIFIFFLLLSAGVSAQNVGVGTPTPLMKLHVSNAESALLLLENTEPLNTNISNSLYFKTGNGTYPYTGALKAIGTGTNFARLGLFTYASSTPNGLLERLSVTDDGMIGIGTVSPLKKLHIQANGTSLLTSAFGDGLLFSTNATSGSRIFLENLNGPVNQKSLAIVNENVGGQGTTYFGSLNDNGSSWVNQSILTMKHENGNVGINTLSPQPSAALDVTSTTKGFLPPRMTSAERDAITPAEGLIIYNTTTNKPNYFVGPDWRNFDGSTTLNIGDAFQGGIVAYILQPGDPGYDEYVTHGIIAGNNNQCCPSWGCYGVSIPGADGTALGTGNQNTIDIMAGCAESNIAARKCGDLVLNGYSDWYLPSKDELNKLYLNKVAIGGFVNTSYWSSTEFNSNDAWILHFTDGFQGSYNKNDIYYYRAVRAF